MNRMLVAGLALLSASTFTRAEGLTHVRELVATNPGMEVIVPYRSLNSSKTSLTLRFDVYPLGSTTKLFSTTAKTFTLPDIGCSAGFKYVGFDEYFTAGSQSGGVYEIMGMSVYQECWNSGGEKSNTSFLYGVNLSAAGKTPWTKTIANSEVWALEPINADIDTADELMVGFDPSGNSKASILLLNPATGATEIPAAEYAYSNSYYNDID